MVHAHLIVPVLLIYRPESEVSWFKIASLSIRALTGSTWWSVASFSNSLIILYRFRSFLEYPLTTVGILYFVSCKVESSMGFEYLSIGENAWNLGNNRK